MSRSLFLILFLVLGCTSTQQPSLNNEQKALIATNFGDRDVKSIKDCSNRDFQNFGVSENDMNFEDCLKIELRVKELVGKTTFLVLKLNHEYSISPIIEEQFTIK